MTIFGRGARLTAVMALSVASVAMAACGDKNADGDALTSLQRSGSSDSTMFDSTNAMAAPGDSVMESASSLLGVVTTEMQHMRMHLEPGIALTIRRLHGIVRSTDRTAPPALNDKQSMLIDIQAADISIDTVSLTNLLNRHVFGYPGAPFRNLRVSVQNGELVQTGSLKKGFWLPFRMRATVSATSSGEIRVHPIALSLLRIGIFGLSNKLGGLGKLVTLEPGHGARIEDDDFILTPSAILPPPRIRGRLTSISLEPGGLRQIFGERNAADNAPLRRAGSTATNYMYFQGGTLRFGKLTMFDTDLEIVDGNPADPFDYALDRYQEHLVGGHSQSTMSDGLIVVMPDVGDLKSAVGTRKQDR